VLLDEAQAVDEESLHRAWQRWLQGFNTAQFLPGILMATAAGLDAHDYEGFGSLGAATAAPAKESGQAALSAAWQQVLEHSVEALTVGLKALASVGSVPPEVGMELTDNKGRVMADAELTWVDEKLAVLRPDQDDLVQAWKSAGWVVEMLDDTLVTIQGKPWQQVVASLLGLTLQKNKE
jgi:DEAD/DEAH box helicase domain-containing protein